MSLMPSEQENIINIIPTFASGFYMNGTIKVINGICYMSPAFGKDSNFDTSVEQVYVGQLPTNCRPLASFYVKCMSGKYELGNLSISTNGDMYYYPTNAYRLFGYFVCAFVVA